MLRCGYNHVTVKTVPWPVVLNLTRHFASLDPFGGGDEDKDKAKPDPPRPRGPSAPENGCITLD